MKVWKILCYLILVLLSPGCQNDPEERALAEHLEDYEAPEYQWQILLNNGKAVPSSFDDIKYESEGLIPVNASGLWGYVDLNGSWVIREEYIEAYSFNEGLARVKATNGLYGFINKMGDFIIPPSFEGAGDVNHRLIRISHNSGDTYIQLDQKVLSAKLFSKASDYKNALAKVKTSKGWQLIDTLGQIGEERYDHIHIGAEGDPLVVALNNQWTYLSSSAKLNTTYDYAEPFYGNHSLVKDKDQWHIINLKGDVLTSSSESLINIGYGCFSIIKNDECHVFLNLERCHLDSIHEIHRISDGFAAYRRKGAWNWLSITGRLLCEQPVDLAWDFENGLAKFASETGIGVIDTQGIIRLQPIYADVRILNQEGLYAVKAY